MFQQSKMCSERESKQLELLRLTSHLKIFTSSKLNWCIVRGVTAYCWSTPMYLFRRLPSHCTYHFKSLHRKKKRKGHLYFLSCNPTKQCLSYGTFCDCNMLEMTYCLHARPNKRKVFQTLSDILEGCTRLWKKYLLILD